MLGLHKQSYWILERINPDRFSRSLFPLNPVMIGPALPNRLRHMNLKAGANARNSVLNHQKWDLKAEHYDRYPMYFQAVRDKE
jgi:hypothetical protein